MKFVSNRRAGIPRYLPPIVSGNPSSVSATACLPTTAAPLGYSRPVLMTMPNDSVVSAAGRSHPNALPTLFPAPTIRIPPLSHTGAFMSNRQPPMPGAHPGHYGLVPRSTPSVASSTSVYCSPAFSGLTPAASVQSLTSHYALTSNHMSPPRFLPPLTPCHTAVAGGSAITGMANLCHTINAPATVPDARHVPATSLYSANGLQTAQPPLPAHIQTVSNPVRAPLNVSYGSDWSAMPSPPGYYQVVRGAASASQHPAVTLASTATAPPSSVSPSRDVGTLLRRHQKLVFAVMQLSLLAFRGASTTISRARTDQYTLSCIGEAYTRLCTIGRLLIRTRDQFYAYADFLRRLDRHVVDIGSVDVATLEFSARCVLDCGKRIRAVHDQWEVWKLPDNVNSQPSGDALAARAAGMAGEVLRLADPFSHTLMTFETAIALAVPSTDSRPDRLPVPPLERHATEVPTMSVREQSANSLNDVVSRYTPEAFEQFRLSPGSAEQRITARWMEDVDGLLLSYQSPVLDHQSSGIPCSSDPQAAPDASVAQPLIVVARNGSGGDHETSPTETDVKFADVMWSDSRKRRTRRTDLGTIDLDPVDDDNGSVLSPSDVTASDPTWANVEDVFVAPAVSVASNRNFGLDRFVQFSFPVAGQPTPSVESSGGNADIEALAAGSESHIITRSSETATDFDIKPFESLLINDVECSGQPSAALPTASYIPEHSNLPGSRTDQAAIPDSDVVDLSSWPDEETVETKPDRSLLDVRWPPPTLNPAVPDKDPGECIRFSLGSGFTACQQQELHKVERPSVSRSRSFDVNDGDGRKRSSSSSSHPVVIDIDDNDEDACCHIVNVYSLPSGENDPVTSNVWDAAGPQPVAEHAPGPGKAATTTADASCQTTSADDELISNSTATEVSAANNGEMNTADFAATTKTSDDIRPKNGAVSRKRRQSKPTRTRRSNSDDVVDNSAPSVCLPKVTKQGDGLRVKRKGGRPAKRHLHSKNDETTSPDFTSTNKFSSHVQPETHDVSLEKCHSATSDKENAKKGLAPSLCPQKVTESELATPPVKKRRGRPPGRSLNSHAVASSSGLSPRPRKVTDKQRDARPVKRKRAQPAKCGDLQSDSAMPLSSVVNRTQTKSVEHELSSDCATANLSTTNDDEIVSPHFTSSNKSSNHVQRETNAISLERCHSATTNARFLNNDSASSLCHQKVTDSESGAPPVKRRRGRPPGCRLHRQAVASSSSVSSKKKRHKTDSTEIAENTACSSEVQVEKNSDKMFRSTLKSVNPPVGLLGENVADHSKDVLSKKQARASMQFWRPGVVNLAPPPVDGRHLADNVAAAGGKVGLAGEWKPMVAKKNLESTPEKNTTSASAKSDNLGDCQPMSADRSVIDRQPESEKHLHSQVACAELEEQWSDVEPMSPPGQTPSVQASTEQQPRKTDERVFEDISDAEEQEQDMQLDEPRRLTIDLETVDQHGVNGSADDTAHRTSDAGKSTDAGVQRNADASSSHVGKRLASDVSDTVSSRKHKSRLSVLRRYRIKDSTTSKLKSSSPKKQSTSTEDLNARSEQHYRSKDSKSHSSVHRTTTSMAHYLMEQWATAAEKHRSSVVNDWKSKLKDTEDRIMKKLRSQDVTLGQPSCRMSELEENQRKQVEIVVVIPIRGRN